MVGTVNCAQLRAAGRSRWNSLRREASVHSLTPSPGGGFRQFPAHARAEERQTAAFIQPCGTQIDTVALIVHGDARFFCVQLPQQNARVSMGGFVGRRRASPPSDWAETRCAGRIQLPAFPAAASGRRGYGAPPASVVVEPGRQIHASLHRCAVSPIRITSADPFAAEGRKDNKSVFRRTTPAVRRAAEAVPAAPSVSGRIALPTAHSVPSKSNTAAFSMRFLRSASGSAPERQRQSRPYYSNGIPPNGPADAAGELGGLFGIFGVQGGGIGVGDGIMGISPSAPV